MSSQLVDLGVAVTRTTPVIQGNANWLSQGGWSVGLSTSYQAGSPRHVAEAIIQTSRGWQASDNWRFQADLAHYRYPSSDRAARTLDRSELGATMVYRDVLTVSVWAVELAHRPEGPRGEADIGFHWPLTSHLSAGAAIGVAQYLAPRHWYAADKRPDWFDYGQVGLHWDNGPWGLDVIRVASDFRRTRYQHPVAPWAATLARRF